MSIKLAAFRKSLTYEITASSEMVLRDLNRIEQVDRLSETQQRRLELQRNKLFVIGILFVIPLIISFNVESFLFAALSSTTAVVVLGVAIYMTIKAHWHSRLNFMNYRYRYALLKEALEMLQRDMKPRANMKINLVLSKPDEKSKFICESAHPVRRGWKINFYRDNWLTIRGRFLDGTRFLLVATERYQVRSGRSVNNNFKTKPRPKGFEIKLVLACPESRYRALPLLQADAVGAVQLPKKVSLKGLKVTNKGIQLKVKVPPQILGGASGTIQQIGPLWRTARQSLAQAQAIQNQALQTQTEILYRTITLMLLSAYQILNLSRMISQRQA